MQRAAFRVKRVIGLVLILVGAVLLLAPLVGVGLGRLAWPLFVLAPGLALFAAARLGGVSALAVPASLVTTVGVLLFYQNLTGRFETWAYAWALVAPTAVGLGVFLHGLWTKNARRMMAGRKLSLLGVMLFLAFAFFFEFVLNLSGAASGVFGRFVLPLGLIAGGLLLLLGRGGSLGGAGVREPRPEPVPTLRASADPPRG